MHEVPAPNLPTPLHPDAVSVRKINPINPTTRSSHLINVITTVIIFPLVVHQKLMVLFYQRFHYLAGYRLSIVTIKIVQNLEWIEIFFYLSESRVSSKSQRIIQKASEKLENWLS